VAWPDGALRRFRRLTHDTLKERAEELGAIFRPIRHAGQLDERAPEQGIQDVIDRAILSDSLLSDIDEAIAGVAPDVVFVR
jgi:hypothetical protein